MTHPPQHNIYHPVVAVGLGPGDPELISVKGLKALQQAEVIFYPASSITEGAANSFSLNIIRHHELQGELLPMAIPMKEANRQENYETAFEQIQNAWQQGKRVAVVSEGDILFYSTFGYLLEHLKNHQIPVELIPGIPAFILGASAMQASLVDGDASFRVLARPQSFEQIEELLDQTDTLVVMKMSVLKGWCEFLTPCGRPFFYAEKLGTPEQFSTTTAKELEHRPIPYFSTIIFKKQDA